MSYIIPDIINQPIVKPEIERVEKEKFEYHLLGTFLRTRGLKLFAYNSIKDELKEVSVRNDNTVKVEPIDGKLLVTNLNTESITIDAKCIYFEALNFKNAEKRLTKYKSGLIKELFNLRKPEGIKLF
jgi:hypothetical protein